nr:retrovirus-related Pol polyprotein from transposon TNT 1-94 [Tanacetum cinerariifolium]
HGCEVALKILPAYMEAQTKAELNKKAHSAVILCLGNKVLREATGETTATGVWSKLETLYMTKSLANKLYMKKKLYTFYMLAGRKIFEHIDDIIRTLCEYLALWTGSFNFGGRVATPNSKKIKERSKAKGDDGEGLYVRGRTDRMDSRQSKGKSRSKSRALTLEDVMATPNSKKIKERSKAKGDDGEGLYVRGRTDRMDSRQSKGKSRSKSRGERLKCYIFQSKDHLKRNCLKNNRKKSTGYVKKDVQPSSSGSTYDDSEVMMVMSAHAQALLDWIMDSGCSYHMTPKLDILFNFIKCDAGSVHLGDNMECKIRGIDKKLDNVGNLEKEGYTVKLQSGKVKVINGYRVILSGIRRDNCVYSLDGHAMAGELNVSVEEKIVLRRMVKKLRTDNGLEFCNREFEQLCIEIGIARHLTVAGTPQQNGVAEQATCTAAYLINRSPSRAIEKKTPMKMWSGHPSDYGMLRIFGCVAYPHDKQAFGEHWKGIHVTWAQLKKKRDEDTTLKEASQFLWTPSKLEGDDVTISFDAVTVADIKKPIEDSADDILISYKSKAEIGSTKSLLKKEFDMKELEEAKKILGMEIIRDRSRKILRVSQAGHVSKILNNFIIDNEKSVKMPLGGHFKLSLKDCPVRDCDVERMSKVPCANAVRSLMYLMVCTRPDIAYAVSVVSRYLANPGKNHWEAAKWILKYLRGTASVGLVCGTNRGNHVDVTGFVDSDYAKYPDKEVLEAKTVKVLNVGTKHNVVDALTNVVPRLKLQHCLELLNVGVG